MGNIDYSLLASEMKRLLPDFDEIRASEDYCHPESCPFKWYWEEGKPSDGMSQPVELVECKDWKGCEFSYFLEHSDKFTENDFTGDIVALAAFEPHYWITRIRAFKAKAKD